jgi:CRP-like cAMP-binding protein
VLVSGALTLEIGSRAPLRINEPGQLIDDLALFCEVQRMATATADERTKLLQLPRPAFMRMLGEYPACAATLHAQLAERLRRNAAELAAIAAQLDGLGKR